MFTMLQQTCTSQTFFLFSSIYQPTSMFTMHSLQNEKRPKCIIESFETLMTRNSIRNSAVEARLAVATGKEKELWNWSRSQNLPGKLGQQSAICWNSLGLFRQRAETFSICLKNIFMKPRNISIHSAHSENFYYHFFYLLSD